MTLKCLWMLIVGLMMMIASTCTRSSANILFSNAGEVPLFDVYIKSASPDGTKEIVTIPPIDDGKQDWNRNDDQLMHQKYTDDELQTLLLSVPILLNYINNLMVTADKLDFPFQAPPAYVYKYIKHPNSIRATLAQLKSDTHNVLIIANTATHRIQSIVQQVPAHLKTAIKLAASTSGTMRKLMLPRTNENLNHLSMEIVDVTKSTLQRFFSLLDFLDEVIELSVTTHASHVSVIPQIRMRKIEASIDQPYLQNNSNNIYSQYPAFTNVLTSAHQVYGEAMEKIEKVHNRRIRQEFSKGNELTKLIDEMAIFNLRTLNSGETIRQLLELVRQISSIREQWTKIIRFFSYLDMDASHIQKIIAEQFVDIIQYAVSTDYFSDPLDHEFFMVLLNQGSEITNMATDSFVILAKQYYTISSEHLINTMVGFRQSLL